jgi:hypothetical protein
MEHYSEKTALESVVNMVVADMHPQELRGVIQALPSDDESAIKRFCENFDLGSWMYEALVGKEIDLIMLLSQIADEMDREYQEEAAELNMITASVRASQGWPL